MKDNAVLYEDNHVIVVIKKSGILSQGDSTNDPDMVNLLKNYLKIKYNKPGNVYVGLVHRLDRMVSGIMVFAKTSKAASRLSEAIREGKFNKGYTAVVHGKLSDKGELRDYLFKESDFSTVIDEKKGKLAILNYEVLDYNKNLDLSLVKVNLVTGRHHQIRVQFASRGYPLYGDKRYGVMTDKGNIALVASYLSFPHPIKGNILEFNYQPNDLFFKN